MVTDDLRALRDKLSLSRVALAHFLGVSEITVVRWEHGAEVKGLAVVLLHAIGEATRRAGAERTRAAINASAINHGRALRDLINLSEKADA